MKLRPFLCLLKILTLFCINAYADESIPVQLKNQANALSSLIRDAYASEHSRNYYLFSHKNGEKGAIVIFNLEGFGGGNNGSQYIAIFSVLSNSEPDGRIVPEVYSLIDFTGVGRRNGRTIESDKITYTYDEKTKETVISAPFLERGEYDPNCCPTIKGVATYRIKVQRGYEIREQSK